MVVLQDDLDDLEEFEEYIAHDNHPQNDERFVVRVQAPVPRIEQSRIRFSKVLCRSSQFFIGPPFLMNSSGCSRRPSQS